MGIQKEVIESEIRATGAKQVQDDLIRVNREMKDLNQEEKNLLFIRNKLESQGKKNTEEWKKNETAIKSNREATAKQREELTKLNSQLKINDLSYNQLSKRANELRGKLNNISKELQPEKWNKYNQELVETNAQMRKVRAGSEQTTGTMSMLSKTAGLLGIGMGSAWAVIRTGKSVIDSTNLSADVFERTMGGLKQMVDTFFISISTGDWSNFWEGLKTSKERAEDLVDTMDVLGDIRRGLSIEEAKLENNKNNILTQLRDKTGRITRDQKKKLYDDLVEMDNAYNSKVLDSAFRERDSILDLYSSITGLRQDRIFELIGQYSNYEKKFNDAADNLKNARAAWLANTKIGQSNEGFNMEEYLQSLSDVDRMYTQLYLNYGKLNDTKLDTLTGSIVAVEKAMGASTRTQLENMRIFNEIFKSQEDINNKNSENLGQDSPYYSIAEFQAEDLKKAEEQLDKYISEVYEIVNDNNINLKRSAEENQKEIDDMKLQHIKTNAEYELELYNQTLEGKKSLLAKQLRDGEIAQAEYNHNIRTLDNEALAAKAEIYGELFGKISQLASKNTTLYKVSAIAEATMATYAGAAKSLNQGGPVWKRLAEMAIIIAQGLIQVKNIVKVKTPSSGYYNGGYSGYGGKYTPSDKVQYHADEYIVASDELAHPQVRNYIGSVVEPMRMRRLGYNAYAQSTTLPGNFSGRAEGGFSGSGSTDTQTLINMQATMELQNVLLNKLLTEGVNSNFDENKIKEMRDRTLKQEIMEARAGR